eukprot:768036-Hanusia_phi.AAC.1
MNQRAGIRDHRDRNREGIGVSMRSGDHEIRQSNAARKESKSNDKASRQTELRGDMLTSLRDWAEVIIAYENTQRIEAQKCREGMEEVQDSMLSKVIGTRVRKGTLEEDEGVSDGGTGKWEAGRRRKGEDRFLRPRASSCHMLCCVRPKTGDIMEMCFETMNPNSQLGSQESDEQGRTWLIFVKNKASYFI